MRFIFTSLFQQSRFLAVITEGHASFFKQPFSSSRQVFMKLNFAPVVSDVFTADRRQKTLNSLSYQLSRISRLATE